MQLRSWSKAGLAVAAGLSLTLPFSGAAHADYAPRALDAVGVGGETPQYNVDFVADGDTAGHAGYNASNNLYKLVSIDATADSNGRAAYAEGSTATSPKALNPSAVLQAGASPVNRPNSTGAGYTALLADTGTQHKIDYIRAASLPTAQQQSLAASNGWGYLHVVQIGVDPLQVVAATNTNAPAGGLSTAELIGIYTGTYKHWNELPGNSGGSTDAIIPLLPISGSSITKTFLADLSAANGSTVTPSGFQTVEQNDPTAITTASNPADAIVPFSIGRLNLWNSGYFKDPAPGGTATLTPGVKGLTGTAPDGATPYSDQVGLYIVFRQSDATSTTPWQPGSTKNWVQTLFSDSDPAGSPYFSRPAAQNLVAAAGATQLYSDLGDVTGT